MESKSAGAIPGRIGPYVIKDILGSGAFASVYRGIRMNGEEEVAVKVFGGSHANEVRPKYRLLGIADATIRRLC